MIFENGILICQSFWFLLDFNCDYDTKKGAYGSRMAKMCQILGVNHHLESFPEDRSLDLNRVEDLLKRDTTYTNVVSN